MSFRTRRAVVLGILILAAFTRLWDINNYPPGLYPDQAANGEDALEILAGSSKVFFERNNGREGLFFYVQAVSVKLLGIGVWPLFLASAVVGITTVAVTYLAGARLFGPLAGGVSAFFLATNPWHVTLSRTGFRAVMTPLFIALTLWFLARLLKREGSPRTADAVLVGVSAGAGLYTYTAYRAFGLFIALCFVVALLRAALKPIFRPRFRTLRSPVIIALASAFIIVIPLLRFFWVNPAYATVRAQHVSIFNPDLNRGDPWRTLLSVTGRTLRAFVWNADGNPRHNVPLPDIPYTSGGIHAYKGGGWPFLSPIPAILALLGVAVALRRAPWLIALFVVMLLPAISTAEGIPHGLRTAGVIPAHVWLAGLGGAWFWERRQRLPWAGVRGLLAAVVVIALIVGAVIDVWLYFGIARKSPLAHYEYRGDLTTVSSYLNERARSPKAYAFAPYLALDNFSVQTVHYLTTPTGHRYRLVKPEMSHVVALEEGEAIIFAQSTIPDAIRYRQQHPEVQADIRKNGFGEVVMVVFTRS